METEEKQEKTCKNCRYFSPHYFKHNARLHIAGDCGQCVNFTGRKRKPVLCEKWEDVKIANEERKKSIKETLEAMAKRIEEIAIILNDFE